MLVATEGPDLVSVLRKSGIAHAIDLSTNFQTFKSSHVPGVGKTDRK